MSGDKFGQLFVNKISRDALKEMIATVETAQESGTGEDPRNDPLNTQSVSQQFRSAWRYNPNLEVDDDISTSSSFTLKKQADRESDDELSEEESEREVDPEDSESKDFNLSDISSLNSEVTGGKKCIYVPKGGSSKTSNKALADFVKFLQIKGIISQGTVSDSGEVVLTCKSPSAPTSVTDDSGTPSPLLEKKDFTKKETSKPQPNSSKIKDADQLYGLKEKPGPSPKLYNGTLIYKSKNGGTLKVNPQKICEKYGCQEPVTPSNWLHHHRSCHPNGTTIPAIRLLEYRE
ncbi:ORF2 protein [Moussa virus]|uniref:ORF2 protein n=1 Tax=Moussa virus TaxID=698672 RepID=D2E9X4_9RHAB|nr:ORF2 protein [Moussa virus]ACZ81399.1 ORF2 protein [Moussa virus]